MGSTLNGILKTGKGTSILLELDAGSYLGTIIKTIKNLQKKDMGGVYISTQRSFKNVSSLFKKHGIDLNRIIFIDVASAASKEPQERCKGCVHISPALDVDEMVRAVYTSLENMKGRKFIFIDSLTTFSLYKPISETLRLTEFLMDQVKNKKNIILILSVAKDLSQKKFIRDVIAHADKTIEIKT